MSLIYGDNFKNQISLTDSFTYFKLFFCCATLVSAENLTLPAITLTQNCYNAMFLNCTSLVKAPELPATTLVNSCYFGMFYGCTSLTTAPELPATILAENCYKTMFNGCTSLTKAPELPATILVENCYNNMFYGCTSLTKAPELPATTLAENCYSNMFQDCTSLTTAPELPATTLAPRCYESMFRGCTSLITAPELPATTLTNYCYRNMFYGCTNLNYIKAMFTATPSTTYTENWVSGVATSGTFVKNSVAPWDVTGVNGIPTNWVKCTDLEYEEVRHYELNIYGTSTTPASTVQKEVSIPFIKVLNPGQIIIIQPTITSDIANSTLKLNDFAAYPMRRNGSAITTTTDSYVWNSAYPSVWIFDGTYWQWIGGYDLNTNTTYSALTQSELNTGTATTGRSIGAKLLRDNFYTKTEIDNLMSSIETILQTI